MIRVFLSASIPLPRRNPEYVETADVVAIRDSIRALVSVVVPAPGKLVFGGHPAITPMVRLLIAQLKRPVRRHVILYQSLYFQQNFLPDVEEFEEVRLVEAVSGDREASLALMREAMIGSEDFDAGIFIGGMEGVEDEYRRFREIHPKKPVFPIASTGAAALKLHQRFLPDARELTDNLLYLSLFRELLNIAPTE